VKFAASGEAPYSLTTRFELGKGITAALPSSLEAAGYTPTELSTEAVRPVHVARSVQRISSPEIVRDTPQRNRNSDGNPPLTIGLVGNR
jgi:hypothetical protein